MNPIFYFSIFFIFMSIDLANAQHSNKSIAEAVADIEKSIEFDYEHVKSMGTTSYWRDPRTGVIFASIDANNDDVSNVHILGRRDDGYLTAIKISKTDPRYESGVAFLKKKQKLDIIHSLHYEAGRARVMDQNRINERGWFRKIRGGLWLSFLGAGLAFYEVLEDGVVTAHEVGQKAMTALDDALMTEELVASELHPDIASFNKLINQMHRTADYFIENNLPMSSRQRQSILVMLDQARDQFGGDQAPPRGMSRIEQQRIYDQITDFRSKLQQIGRNHPQDAGSTQQKTTTGHK